MPQQAATARLDCAPLPIGIMEIGHDAVNPVHIFIVSIITQRQVQNQENNKGIGNARRQAQDI